MEGIVVGSLLGSLVTDKLAIGGLLELFLLWVATKSCEIVVVTSSNDGALSCSNLVTRRLLLLLLIDNIALNRRGWHLHLPRCRSILLVLLLLLLGIV